MPPWAASLAKCASPIAGLLFAAVVVFALDGLSWCASTAQLPIADNVNVTDATYIAFPVLVSKNVFIEKSFIENIALLRFKFKPRHYTLPMGSARTNQVNLV